MENENVTITKEKKYYLEVGNDNGNSEHDIVINGDSIEQPNIITKVNRLPMLDEISIEFTAKNIHDRLLCTVNSPSCTAGTYYSGKYALQSGERIRNIEVGADNSKVESEIIVINTLNQLAAYGVNKAYKEDPSFILDQSFEKKILLNVDMTTSLPVTQYSKVNAEIMTNKFMNGTHQVTVHVGVVRVNFEITFEFVKVIPEGVTAIHAIQNMLLINKPEEKLTEAEKNINKTVTEFFAEFNKTYDLKVDGAYFKKKKVLHTGIGEGTTEYPMTDDVVFDPRFIKGSNNGVGHAIDKALPIFKEEKGLRTYSRQNYSAVLRDQSHKYYDEAKDIIEPYIEEESEEILHNIKTEAERANFEVDINCVYGGGSILMRDYLYNSLKTFTDKADIKLLYVPKEYAVTLESKGMYEFTKGNIFKALKKKHYAAK